MIELNTIQPNKAVKGQKYLTHIEDFINRYQTLCGKTLEIGAYRCNKRAKSDINKMVWPDKNVCYKCLIELGIIEKTKAYYEKVAGTKTLTIECKVLVDFEVQKGIFKKGQTIYTDEI